MLSPILLQDDFPYGPCHLLLQCEMFSLWGSAAFGRDVEETVMDPVKGWISCLVFTCSSPASGEETTSHLGKEPKGQQSSMLRLLEFGISSCWPWSPEVSDQVIKPRHQLFRTGKWKTRESYILLAYILFTKAGSGATDQGG